MQRGNYAYSYSFLRAMSSAISDPSSSSAPADPLAVNPAKARIVAAARVHFFTHGFRNVTMDCLAEELGMSKKTLYAHFTSKTEILEAVLYDQCARVQADLDQVSRGCADDFTGCLQQLLACAQRYTGEIQPPFIRDMAREAPEMFAIITRRRREILEQSFGRLFNEGRRAGFIRQDLPVKLILEILLGAVEAVVNPVKMNELDLTPKTGFSSIISVVLRGIVTEEGRAKL